jgi:hypothetical protein
MDSSEQTLQETAVMIEDAARCGQPPLILFQRWLSMSLHEQRAFQDQVLFESYLYMSGRFVVGVSSGAQMR